MFAGLQIYENSPPIEAWVNADVWANALYPKITPDLTGHSQGSRSLLVDADIYNTPWSHHQSEAPLVSDNLRIAFWGRLDNREALSQQLKLERPLREIPDVNLILGGWYKWGEALPEHLLGDFTFAIIDTEKHSVFLARDPIGVKPLYYWPHEQGLVFASTPTALCRLKNIKPTPDVGWVARYILSQSSSQDRTAYNEILKLPGGHCLNVVDGKVTVRRYHQWRDDAPDAFVRKDECLDAYRAALEDAMRNHMVSDYTLGTENSGGIDSATITAYLAKYLDDPQDRLFSFGFALSEEEPAFILETSQAAGIRHNYLITSRVGELPFDAESITDHLEILGYPEEHGNGTAHQPFYELCQSNGIRTLFSGYGGDEVVTNYGNNIWSELFDKKQYAAAIRMKQGSFPMQALRAIKHRRQQRNNNGYNTRFRPVWEKRWLEQPLRQDIVEQYDLQHEFMETARYDAPFNRHNDWIINGLLQMPYVPTRLENCTLMAASYGIDYRWPLWDQRLVQQYLSTPIIERYGPELQNRYLHRRAITGTVPKRVAWKKSKYMGETQAPITDPMIGVTKQMRSLDDSLHPMLSELIDLEKWRGQIEKIERGPENHELKYSAQRTTKALTWLNVWLNANCVE